MQTTTDHKILQIFSGIILRVLGRGQRTVISIFISLFLDLDLLLKKKDKKIEKGKRRGLFSLYRGTLRILNSKLYVFTDNHTLLLSVLGLEKQHQLEFGKSAIGGSAWA